MPQDRSTSAAAHSGVRNLAAAGTGAADGSCGRCAARGRRGLSAQSHHLERPRLRGHGPRHRRPGHRADSRTRRIAPRTRRDQSAPQGAARGNRDAARLRRRRALADLGQAAPTAGSITPMPPMRGRPKPPASPTRSIAISNCSTATTAATMDAALNDAAAFTARLPIVVGGERRIYDVHALNVGGGSAGIAIDASEADRAARGAGADGGSASPHPRSVVVRRRGVRRPAAAGVLQRFLSPAVGSRPRLPRQQSRRFQRARPPARRRASCRSSRISGPGRPSCTRPIAPSSPPRTPGTCPTAARVSVVTTPNPEGGVTYLFDDVTESLDLARRFDGLIRVQRETLDNLAEAVAVFGSNGRAQLFNPAFARMWKLSPEALREQPHIETVEAWCRPLFDDDDDLARRSATPSPGSRTASRCR